MTEKTRNKIVDIFNKRRFKIIAICEASLAKKTWVKYMIVFLNRDGVYFGVVSDTIARLATRTNWYGFPMSISEIPSEELYRTYIIDEDKWKQLQALKVMEKL